MITNYLQPTDIILNGNSTVTAKWVCHPQANTVLAYTSKIYIQREDRVDIIAG